MLNQSNFRKAVNGFLTLGASLTLGLLSFGGVYAITPVLSLGIAAFVLSTFYEGEIYSANIRDALKKLLTPNYYKQDIARKLLDKILTEYEDTADTPQFIKDYREQMRYVDALKKAHRHDSDYKKQLKAARKKLRLMQHYFMQTLFDEPINQTQYAKTLSQFITSIELSDKTDKRSVQDTLTQKTRLIRLGLAFSITSGIFFGLGTIYLLLESLSALTFIQISVSALPYIVLPLATLSGASYIFLIYNSLSDMIWNETLNNWYADVKRDVQRSSRLRATAMVASSVLLIVLGLALTAFTAGTWWTIGKQSKNMLPFLKKIPKAITGVLLPFFTGLAALVFTLENTKGSMDTVTEIFCDNCKEGETEEQDSHSCVLNEAENTGFWTACANFFVALVTLMTRPFTLIAKSIYHQYQKENILSFINPFRLAINLVEKPMQVTGFILHILSIGVTTDRIPGVPPIISALLSATSEGFEDFHYFVAGKTEHECNHSHDLPTQFFRLVLSPLYFLSGCWVWATNQCYGAPISFRAAINKQFNHDHQHKHHDEPKAPKISATWQQQSILMRLSNQRKSYTGEDSLSKKKHKTFERLISVVTHTPAESLNGNIMQDSLKAPAAGTEGKTQRQLLSQHRHFFHMSDKTSGERLIEEIDTELTASNQRA